MAGFTADDMMAIAERYPRLKLASDGAVEGILDLHAVFAGEERTDAFAVRITAPAADPGAMPSLSETGGRTAAIAAKHSIGDLADLHRNPDGTACVCVKQDERNRFPRGAGLAHFLEELAVPYLFGLSHFDEVGKWPWPDYSHGALGIAEYYGDVSGPPSADDIARTLDLLKQYQGWREFSRQIRKPSAMRMCICGSRKPISRCHKGVWAGLQKLHYDITFLRMNLRRTLQK